MSKVGKGKTDFALFWEILSEGLLKRNQMGRMLVLISILLIFSCVFEIYADTLKKEALKDPFNAYNAFYYIFFYSLHITFGWMHSHLFYYNLHHMKSLLYQHLVQKYLKCDQKSFAVVGTGRVCSIINKQVDDVLLLLKYFLLDLFYNVAYLLFFFIELLVRKKDTPLYIKTAFIALFIGTIIYIYIVCRLSLPKKKRLVTSIHSNSHALLDIFRNSTVVKAFNKESAEVERHKSRMKSQVALGSEFYLFEMLHVVGFKMLLFLSLVIPWVLFIKNDEVQNLRDILIYFTEFFDFKRKISGVKNSAYSIFDVFSDVSGSSVRLTEAQKESPGTAVILKDRFDIRFDQISISQDNMIVFTNFTFTAASGQKIAVTGRNGAGKSTIIKALLGMVDCTGNIYFSDINIQNIGDKTIRDVISYVSQTPNLFNTTVMENLKYGNDISDEAVMEKCIECGVHEMFSSLEDGYGTVVGEDSRNVSGGQAQMVNVMRAVIKDAPIFLMDEPTSNLDNHTSKMILHIVFNVLKEKTVFLSTHNPMHLAKFDRILNINEKMVKVFTYDEFKGNPVHNDWM